MHTEHHGKSCISASSEVAMVLRARGDNNLCCLLQSFTPAYNILQKTFKTSLQSFELGQQGLHAWGTCTDGFQFHQVGCACVVQSCGKRRSGEGREEESLTIVTGAWGRNSEDKLQLSTSHIIGLSLNYELDIVILTSHTVTSKKASQQT